MNRVRIVSSALLIIVISAMMTFADSTPTFASEVFVAEVSLSPPAPSVVSVGAPISATVDFGHGFSSIESLCFDFHFQDDLLDPGDSLSFTGPFGLNGAGFFNVSTPPQSDRTLCFIAGFHPETLSLFLDGQQDFGIQMEVGSVVIGALTIQITGQGKVNVSVDIKPGSDTNPINPRSREVISVAILTTDTFDATTVDPQTVRFGPNAAVEAHSRIEDVNEDGKIDLVLQFNTQDTGIECGDTSASLTGETFDGQVIEGSDSIRTVGCM